MKTTLGKASDTYNAIGAEIQRLGKVALGMLEDRREAKKRKSEAIKSPKRNFKEDKYEEEIYGRTRYLLVPYNRSG